MRLPVIRTERFVLRPWTLADVDALHALWIAPEVRRYLWDNMIITRDVAQQAVNSHPATAASDGIGFWALLARPARPLIAGFCGFRFIDDGTDIELLYGLRSAARTGPPHEQSVQVMKRLGMTQEAAGSTGITYILRRPV
jgi:ribosomal-protein-alanine N-acetyltransferase